MPATRWGLPEGLVGHDSEPVMCRQNVTLLTPNDGRFRLSLSNTVHEDGVTLVHSQAPRLDLKVGRTYTQGNTEYIQHFISRSKLHSDMHKVVDIHDDTLKLLSEATIGTENREPK